jgi:hypothetical protein
VRGEERIVVPLNDPARQKERVAVTLATQEASPQAKSPAPQASSVKPKQNPIDRMRAKMEEGEAIKNRNNPRRQPIRSSSVVPKGVRARPKR